MGEGSFSQGWLMKRVEVHWGDRRDGANFSIDLKNWCREQGLVLGNDYSWQFKADENTTVFYFEDHVESYATLFSLRWAGNEI